MTALLLIATAAWAILEAALSAAETPAPWSLDHLRSLATGLALLAIQVSALVEHAWRHTPGSLWGLLLLCAGAALRLGAISALGPSFVSPAQAPPRVVTTGLYRVLHHPSEIGLLAIAAGSAVLLGSGAAAALTALALLPLSLARCRAEDRVLGRVLGGALASSPRHLRSA